MPSSDNAFDAGPISFVKPSELEVDVRRAETITIIRLRNPDYRMEINLLVGPLLDVVKNTTPTQISYYPPEGQEMTDGDRVLVSRMFLGAIEGDTVLDTGDEITPFSDREGSNRNGHPFYEKAFFAFPDQSVYECTVLVFDPQTTNVAVIGCRANLAVQEQVEEWKEEILQDLNFLHE